MFREREIKLHLSKCRIGERTVEFLGHIESECESETLNIKDIQDLKRPKKVQILSETRS